MATYGTRVTVNRAALSELELAVADGLLEHAQAIVDAANPPSDAGEDVVHGHSRPPLAATGAAAAWAGTKKVGGSKSGGREVSKPHSLKLQRDVITAVGGFGFPARFNEMGTAHQPARPFLTPVFLRMARDAEGPVGTAVRASGVTRKP